MSLRKRPDWSRRLPRPLSIPGIMTLATLADVRVLIDKHMPSEFRDKSTWQHVRRSLVDAAAGACEPRDVVIALRLNSRWKACPAGRAEGPGNYRLCA